MRTLHEHAKANRRIGVDRNDGFANSNNRICR